MNANMYCDIPKQSMIPSLQRLGHRAEFQHDNDHCLAKEAEGKGDVKHACLQHAYGQACLQTWTLLSICGASSNGRWRSARSLTSTSSVMSSFRSGRGLQWKPVKLWWSPCSRGLRQCWKIMVATQNIDTWAQFGHFHLGVYSLSWPAV